MNNRLRAALFAAAVASVLMGCGNKGAAPDAQQSVASSEEEKVLNVYNWTDYIAADTIEKFTAKTGIKVNYEMYDSNEVLETRLLAGNSGFDIVVPSANFLERQIRAGVFQKLDKAQLPNAANLDPDVMRRVAEHDPGNEHAVPYMWGTTGIGYNETKVKAALGDMPITSWKVIFDPEYARKLQSCGIAILDSPEEVLKITLKYLGREPNSEKEEDLKAAEATLLAIRPFVRKINSTHIEDLATEQICIALGFSGDILQARDRAKEGKEAKQGVVIAYSVPIEGTVIWFDTLAVPDDAKHPRNAHAFINFLMEPQIAANNSNEVNYANPNPAALEYVKDEVKNEPGIYPGPDVKARLFPSLAVSEDFNRSLTRMWTRFTTGQ
jgi:putrescine transport system substrate-binding protein